MTVAQEKSQRAFWVLIGLTGFYLWMSTCSTLWDRDETFYARVAMEMVQSGDYLVPTFNGAAWLEKPNLLYWLMSISIKVFGPTEFAFRFFSVIGSALNWWLTFLIGRRLFGHEVGFWSLPILATMTLYLVIGGSATTDAILAPCVTATVWIFLQTLNRPLHPKHVLFMGLTMGLGTLAKGPVGFAPVPIIVVMAWLLRKEQQPWWALLGALICASALASLIFLAWAWPVNQATDGEFYREFFGRHVFARAANPMQGHGGKWLMYLPYYLIVILVGICPWTLYLPGAISAWISQGIANRRGWALVIAWTLPIVVIMTISATKLPNYIFVIWPGLALAMAGTLIAGTKGTLRMPDQRWLHRGLWLYSPMALATVLTLFVGPWFIEMPGLRLGSTLAGIVYFIMAFWALRCHFQERYTRGAMILAVGMIVFVLSVILGVLPAVERNKLSPQLGRIIREQVSPAIPLYSYRFGEPSLCVYTDRMIIHLHKKEEFVSWCQQNTPATIIISSQALANMQTQIEPPHLKQIGSVKGINYTKGKPMELVILTREGL